MKRPISAPLGRALVKTAGPPEGAADILRRAALEMGAEISQEESPPDGMTLTVHGNEKGVIWAVQAHIKSTWRGCSVELTALGGGMRCPDIFDAGVKRLDTLAKALRA